jgi:hypothetical protein
MQDIIEVIPLLSAECVVFDLSTNRHWWHQIPKKIPTATPQTTPRTTTSLLPSPPSPPSEERISITFRRIETYTDSRGRIIGQGSPFKTSADADADGSYQQTLLLTKVKEEQEQRSSSISSISSNISSISSRCTSKAALIQAFSEENKKHADFSWEETYGEGFIQVHDHEATT